MPGGWEAGKIKSGRTEKSQDDYTSCHLAKVLPPWMLLVFPSFLPS
jgi:hypothetical protein